MANPFKVGDLVVHNKPSIVVARKVAEVDGNFVRTQGNSIFHHYREYTPYKRPEEVIVIVTDGEASRAYLKVNGAKVKEVNLKRNSADKHDLKVLTAFAVQKLLPQDDRELVARPAGYCGAVAVVGPTRPEVRPPYKPGLIMEFFGGKWRDAPVLSKFYNVRFYSFPELLKFCQNLGFDVVELHRDK